MEKFFPAAIIVSLFLVLGTGMLHFRPTGRTGPLSLAVLSLMASVAGYLLTQLLG